MNCWAQALIVYSFILQAFHTPESHHSPENTASAGTYLWNYLAELGHADEKPPQSADEPQDSRNIPQKWSQPKKVQHLVCCTRVRTYHLSVEVSEHFPLQMSPHPERHPLPSGRFFLPHNCWENPTAPTAGAPPVPLCSGQSFAASAVERYSSPADSSAALS